MVTRISKSSSLNQINHTNGPSSLSANLAETAQHAAQKVQKDIARAVKGTLGLSGERMSRVDTAWLRMDSSSNLMMIVGVWMLKPGISHANLCERIENSLLQFRRFKQRVVEDTAGATWVDDDRFDLSQHVVIEKLPKHAKGQHQTALQDRIAELAMVPLNRKRQKRRPCASLGHRTP